MFFDAIIEPPTLPEKFVSESAPSGLLRYAPP